MHNPPTLARAAALAFALGASLSQAQVLGTKPGYLPVVRPAYYEAVDLGRVAERYPIGCLSRGGLVAVTSQSWDPDAQATTIRAMYPNASWAFYRVLRRDSWVTGCNSNREIVGYATGIGNVVWDEHWSQAQVLNGSLNAINNARQVAGSARNSLYTDWAVVFNTSTANNDPTVSVRWITPGVATGINDNGIVSITGFNANTPGVRWAAVAAASGGAAYAPPLPNATISWANGIGTNNHLVGGLQDAGGAWRGFVWHATEGFASLQPTWDAQGTMPHAEGRSVGPDRTAVGQSSNSTDPNYRTRAAATVWPNAGGPRNLNRETSMRDGSALPKLVDAIAISDSGQILCEGRDANGVRRAVLLTPRVGGRWSLLP